MSWKSSWQARDRQQAAALELVHLALEMRPKLCLWCLASSLIASNSIVSPSAAPPRMAGLRSWLAVR